MLEARDRVGGRVHTYSGARFGGPVDLGASIITGTATDAGKGLRADPSAIVARWVPRVQGSIKGFATYPSQAPPRKPAGAARQPVRRRRPVGPGVQGSVVKGYVSLGQSCGWLSGPGAQRCKC